jgi:hypothetical protein
VLQDQSFARELGARAASVVRERFGWTKVAESFAELCVRAVRLRRAKESSAQLEEELRTVT